MRYFDHCYQLRYYLTTATRDVVLFKLVLLPSAFSSATTNDDVKPIQKIVTILTILRTDGFIIEDFIVNRGYLFLVVGSDLRSSYAK